MDDKTLYAAILGIVRPWTVEDVELKLSEGEVHVRVALPKKVLWVCPECEERAPIHDHKERSWRHLDTCQYKTIVHAQVPRLKCPNHGTKQLKVPWAESGSRFTALFEALAIDWLKQASISAVAKQLRLSWDEAAGIQERAVKRGLARRKLDSLELLGIDETSFRRRHQYVSIVTDLARTRVLFVGDDRRLETLDPFWESLTEEQLEGIRAVAMDMWEPFIQSTLKHVPDAESKIVFDKFHVVRLLSKAVDEIRRREHRELMALGKDWLKGTKYDWLRNPNQFSLSEWRSFLRLVRMGDLRTGRAWTIKESFKRVWEYRYLGAARRYFGEWYGWARRSKLEPIKKVALTLCRYWDNIETFIIHGITTAGSESVNSIIQRVKRMARGFRNRTRFRMTIYFHCGGLDLYPEGVMHRL